MRELYLSPECHRNPTTDKDLELLFPRTLLQNFT
jgi:hypothetical protein